MGVLSGFSLSGFPRNPAFVVGFFMCHVGTCPNHDFILLSYFLFANDKHTLMCEELGKVTAQDGAGKCSPNEQQIDEAKNIRRKVMSAALPTG